MATTATRPGNRRSSPPSHLSVDRHGGHHVAQLHLGGGTPTFLSHDEMRQLLASVREHFTLVPNGEYSIEVDPRKVDSATVGCSRSWASTA